MAHIRQSGPDSGLGLQASVLKMLQGVRSTQVSEQVLRSNVKRFRGGLVFKAYRLVYHSTLGSRVMNKKKKFVIPHACRGVPLQNTRRHSQDLQQ